jgi:hypothetical protein
VIDDMAVAVEARSARTIASHHLKGMRQLAADHPDVARRIVVCMEDTRRRTNDGIEIMPYGDFVNALWSGDLFWSDLPRRPPGHPTSGPPTRKFADWGAGIEARASRPRVRLARVLRPEPVTVSGGSRQLSITSPSTRTSTNGITALIVCWARSGCLEILLIPSTREGT